MRSLTKPDSFGNYYLQGHIAPIGPAIFKSQRIQYIRDERKVVDLGTFIVLLGTEKGFLFEGECLKQFPSALDALEEINSLGA